eukprot:gene8082-9944_t
MTTLVGGHKDFGHALYQLCELEFDAVETYKASIERVKDQGTKDMIQGFMEEHQLHISEITQILKNHEHKCPDGPSSKSYLTKGKIMISNVVGDSGIISAMVSNEEETNKAYSNILKRDDRWDDCIEFLKKGLDDEIRHTRGLEEKKSSHGHQKPSE